MCVTRFGGGKRTTLDIGEGNPFATDSRILKGAGRQLVQHG
jgi:hypothetical protein